MFSYFLTAIACSFAIFVWLSSRARTNKLKSEIEDREKLINELKLDLKESEKKSEELKNDIVEIDKDIHDLDTISHGSEFIAGIIDRAKNK